MLPSFSSLCIRILSVLLNLVLSIGGRCLFDLSRLFDIPFGLFLLNCVSYWPLTGRLITGRFFGLYLTLKNIADTIVMIKPNTIDVIIAIINCFLSWMLTYNLINANAYMPTKIVNLINSFINIFLILKLRSIIFNNA